MINRLLAAVVKLLLWLRYRIRVRGIDAIAARGRRGILFLPNHPALIDPIILATYFLGPFQARALADEHQIDRFLIRRLARRINVLPIPDVVRGGQAAVGEVRRVVARCIEALRAGDNLILYPAGRVYRGRLEEVRANSAVETILRELPEVRVVLVRTRGLWGSSYSWASGREPNVTAVMRRGAKALLASGVFFAPRRPVTIELVEPAYRTGRPADLPRQADRTVLNRYLEDFYNADAPPNTYVPYTPWERGGARAIAEPPAPGTAGDLGQVPAATREIVRRKLAELTGSEDLADKRLLARDLGMDSLARAELLLWLHEEFGAAPPDVEAIQTVGDVLLAACGEAVAARRRQVAPPAPKWFRRLPRPARPEGLPDMTICQAFLYQARRNAGAAAVADPNSGVRTYRQLVLAVLALRDDVSALPGERVGIMLPASVAAVATYLTLLFAGKTPVMVNWTLGRQNLRHTVESVGVQRILTSRRLVERLAGQGIDLGEVSARLVMLEDIAAGIGRWRRLRAWAASRLSWRRLRRASPPETAAILFTSGSESVPKAVPLTHRNMLANVYDCWERFAIYRNDAIVGILPPFHSFGLTTSILLPLTLGLRAVYWPDPTDSAATAATIDAFRGTILIGTPTFLNGIVRSAGAANLDSLRLVVSGAETCPPRVYEALARRCPAATVMEGYGVTECSPVISVNPAEGARPGTIGPVLGSLEHMLVDPRDGSVIGGHDTGQPAQATSQGGLASASVAGASDSVSCPPITGVLLVRGPSVFSGYLNYDGPSPFVEAGGRQWYRTGDLVHEGPDGWLTFAGRLKRFVKIGGEMISLPAIEAVLDRALRTENDEGPILAVTATASEERPEIVLVTTRAVDRDAANRIVREAGLSGLHNLRRVVRVEELPLLGTGKTDYRALEGLIRLR